MKRNPFEIYTNPSGKSRPANLDWEESALDEQSQVEGFADPAGRPPPRLFWLKVVIILACAALGIKLFSLQISSGAKYRQLAEGNRLRNQTILAPRGQILDRTGLVLANNTASFGLVAVPADLTASGLPQEIEKLAGLLNIDKDDVAAKLRGMDPNSLQPVPLEQNLTQEQSILFETHSTEFYGFSVSSIPIRQYPDPKIFSHALGYTGLISPDELSRLASDSYEINDFIGKSGVELAYDK